ncbi:nitrous oxide reductase family maturation protein NosD [Alkalihalobacillus sp. BA299]|uniref:nitrous oxide reductase family maturation protein NosD n=1 Tax=Alkalihalobacillus sp. BA299 TaxID=2815938 RepID=UPI001FFE0291|nr:nitrous oxide reductase family maturation protein NosD [Alkalihalobacillus sp. BA299]
MVKKVALFILLFSVMSGDFVLAKDDLQKVIDDTPANGVIELSDQVYDGNITISKPLTINGSKKTIIRGDGTGNVISILAENVHIENITVENSSFSLNSTEEFAAIKIHTDHNTIKDLQIKDAYHGIYLSQAHYNTIENIHVSGKGNQTVNGQGNGIHVYYSNFNQLIENEITGTRDGLFFDYSNENEVKGNVLKNTRYGLHFMYSNHNLFLNNQFSFNTGGAAIMNSSHNTIHQNEFSLNQSTRSFGLLLQMANDNTITENVFFQNQRALFIDQSQNNRIEANDISQNQIGMELWASAKHQVITENTFFRNVASIITIGGLPETKWSENNRGNDWGNDIPLFDLNQDGIGDTPLKYSSSLYRLIEKNELVYLFLNSPTIMMYEKINQLVNKDEVMLVDEHPLMTKRSNRLLTWTTVPLLLIMIAVYIGRKRRKL